MLRFKDFISEMNTTLNMLYAVPPEDPEGLDPEATQFSDSSDVASDFNVGSPQSWDPDEIKNMTPWQIENAIISARRRQEIVMWLQAAGANSKRSVANKSIPLPPEWQGGWMK